MDATPAFFSSLEREGGGRGGHGSRWQKKESLTRTNRPLKSKEQVILLLLQQRRNTVNNNNSNSTKKALDIAEMKACVVCVNDIVFLGLGLVSS